MWGNVECVCIKTVRIICYLLPAWCVRILTTKLLTAGRLLAENQFVASFCLVSNSLRSLQFSHSPHFVFVKPGDDSRDTATAARPAGRFVIRTIKFCQVLGFLRAGNISPRDSRQQPACAVCWWCSDVSIIAEVQKRSGCQNILNSFIISAKKQLLWDNKVICLGGFILINHVHLFRCATLATETGRYMSDKINF